jgi:hypothetical protein
MLFKYKIDIEVESFFELPLLGVDISGAKREIINEFVKESINEFIDDGKHTGTFEKTLTDDNLNVTVKCGKHLGNSNIKR